MRRWHELLFYFLEESIQAWLPSSPIGILLFLINKPTTQILPNRHLPLTEPIDLLNVAFENPRTLGGNTQPSRKKKKKLSDSPGEIIKESRYNVPDRLTGVSQVEEFRRLAPERTWNFVSIIHNCLFSEIINKFYRLK